MDYGWKKGRNQATLIGKCGPPVTPTCFTRTTLSTNRPCVMRLTPIEFKQVGVTSSQNAPIRIAWLRPFLPHDDTRSLTSA
ncbi:hypothetical protein Y032_0329g2650 [Ancylostoma ceylanicum]|uniref:Uncharacterized protein n=1 Tax=Ancylostoma ceylanicum TaxID=53326 RepID=A0A016S089_9BILA|nr:hypothetical protein Y032_0329g2650 [Ancylostoma ceylanicum]